MKNVFTVILSIIIMLTPTACNTPADNSLSQNETSISNGTAQIETTPDSESLSDSDTSDKPAQDENDDISVTNICITAGGSVFSAKLYDNEATRALIAQFPLTLDMSELNANEKYYYLPDKLPTASEPVGTINTGDLMLYGSDCLVLFYKSFSTSYSYTRLGYIKDVSGLTAALGSGNVEITFEIT